MDLLKIKELMEEEFGSSNITTHYSDEEDRITFEFAELNLEHVKGARVITTAFKTGTLMFDIYIPDIEYSHEALKRVNEYNILSPFKASIIDQQILTMLNISSVFHNITSEEKFVETYSEAVHIALFDENYLENLLPVLELIKESPFGSFL